MKTIFDLNGFLLSWESGVGAELTERRTDVGDVIDHTRNIHHSGYTKGGPEERSSRESGSNYLKTIFMITARKLCLYAPLLLFPCHPNHQRIDSGRYTQSQVGEEPDVTCMYVYVQINV